MNDPNLNIIFICGSAQEGADGIGDYTRRLSTCLSQKGNLSSIVAFSDAFVNEPVIEIQKLDHFEVEVYRIPKQMKDNEKFILLKEHLNKKNPDWISLQYVLYAYNNKGLPFKFAQKLKEVIGDKSVQIMFHELWLGMEKYPVLKDKIYGFFQSKIIKGMIKVLQPKVVHTHSRAYKILLNYHGISALHLPIFSNIPIAKEIVPIGDVSIKKEFQIVLFGHISPGAPIQSFAKELKQFQESNDKFVKIIFAGRNGNAISEWISALDDNQIAFEQKGVMTSSELSGLMANCDAGIATTPVLLYEKSGSVAAMLKHGLCVLNIAAEWLPETIVSFAYAESITEYVPGVLSTWFTKLHKNQPLKNLELVADQMVHDLNKA